MRSPFTPLLWVLLATVIYSTAFMLEYGLSPLGMHPVLDGKENLIMARQLAQGAWDGEPFFRAPLYPALLSVFTALGLPDFWLPHAARFLNALCHLLSTFLVFALAHRICAKEGPSAIAAALYGLNPVALHFAGDPLDATLSVTLLLGALLCVAPARAQPDSGRRAAGTTPGRLALGGLLLGLGVAARPNLLSAALVIPLFPLLHGICSAHSHSLKKRALESSVIFSGLALPLLALGAANLAVSGHFKILPTQGAFNFWSANKSGAHGKYHEQVMDIQTGPEGHRNPARVESERLLEKATGSPPADVFALQAYWHQRALDAILEDPVAWAGRLIRKAYYLLNHYEQYNNKTYAFHKEQSRWLRYNPLGWAWLLVAGVLGAVLAWRVAAMRLIVLAAVGYAAGLLLFYVSARFRLPLAALLAVTSAGLWVALPAWRRWRPRTLLAGIVITAALLLVSLSRWADVADPSTRVMDHLLMAQAAFEHGDDPLAARQAEAALEYRPQLKPARELLCLARFNTAAVTHPEWLRDPTFLHENLALAQSVSSYSPQVDFTAAVYLWHLGEGVRAVARWTAIARSEAPVARDALAALLWTGNASPRHTALARRLARDQSDPLLAAALGGTAGQAQDNHNPYYRHLLHTLGDPAPHR